MTETERTALLQACAFASVFIGDVEHEIFAAKTGPTPASTASRKRSAKQLQAALRIIEEE
jgi:hypothetical protein